MKRLLITIIALLTIIPTGIAQTCNAVAMPLTEDFDEGVELPTCWVGKRNYDVGDKPSITSDYHYNGTGSLMLYSGTNSLSHYSMAIAPEMASGYIRDYHVRLQVLSPTAGTKIEIGVCDDTGTYTHNFSAIATLTIENANEWQEEVIDLSGYSGSGKRVAFRLSRPQQTAAAYCYIDKISIERCGAWKMQASHITTQSMQISFATYGNGTQTIKYGTTASYPTGANTIATASSPTTIDELDDDTRYTFEVMSTCESEGSGSSPEHATASTLPHHYYTPAYCEKYDAGVFPTDWQRPLRQGTLPDISTTRRYDGFALRLTTSTMATLPEAQLPSGMTMGDLNISLMMNSTDAHNAMLIVGVTEYPTLATDFTPIDTLSCSTNDSWQKVDAMLQGYTGAGRYIVLKGYSANNEDYDIYIDNVNVSSSIPANVGIGNVSDDGCEVTWSEPANYHGDGITAIYGTPGFDLATGRRKSMTGGSDTIAGLTPDQDYEIAIIGNSRYAENECVLKRYTIHTQREALKDGYCDNMEGYAAGAFPADWYRPMMANETPAIADNGGIGDSKSLTATVNSNNSANWPIASLPMLSKGELKKLYLHFWANSTTNYGRLQIGVMSNPNNASTFQVIETLTTSTNGMTEHVVSLERYSGTGKYIALRFGSTVNSATTFYIDNLSLTTCGVKQTSLYPTADGKLQVSWQPYGETADGYTIEYGTAGFAPGTGTTTAATGTSHTIAWPAATECDVYVSNNGDKRLCHFACDSVRYSDDEYCMNFDDYGNEAMPEGWSRPAIVERRPSTYSHQMEFAAKPHHPSMAITPLLQSHGWEGKTLSFDYVSSSGSVMQVGTIQNPEDTSTFAALTTINHSDSPQHIAIDLAAAPSEHHYIAWKYMSNGNAEMVTAAMVDNINIGPCQIKEATALHITQHDAKLSWNAIGSMKGAWIAYSKTSKANTSIATTLLDSLIYADNNGYTIPNLEEGAYYTLHIWPQCETGENRCTYHTTYIHTLDEPQGVPYCQNFDEYYADGDYKEMPVPIEWRRIGATTMLNAGHYSHPALSLTADYGKPAIAVLPEIITDETCIQIDKLTITLWAKASTPSSQTLEIGVMSDAYDAESFTPITTCSIDEAEVWEPKTLRLNGYSGTGRYIAIRLQSNDYNTATTLIDDLCVERCVAEDYTIDDIEQNSVTISWNSIDVNTLICEYGYKGFEPGTGTVAELSTSPATIEGLNADTLYDFMVMPLCPCDINGSISYNGSGTSGKQNGRQGYGSGKDDEEKKNAGYVDGVWQWNNTSGTDSVLHTQASTMTLPYCLDFEDGEPEGWRHEEHVTITNTTSYNGDYSTLMQGIANKQRDYIVLPPVADGTIQDKVLSFYIYSSPSQGTPAIEVGVVRNAYHIESFVATDTLRLTQTNGWQQMATTFDHYDGDYRYITLRPLKTSSSITYYIDDMHVGDCDVTHAQIQGIQGSNVDVAWKAWHHPTVTIEVGEKDFEQGSGTKYTSMDETIHLTGISATADILVYSACNDTDISCFPYRLPVTQSVAIPYCQDFESYADGEAPRRWELRSDTPTENIATATAGADPMGGTKSLKIPCGKASDAKPLIILPAVDSRPLSELYATLSYKMQNSTLQRIAVGYINDAETFVGVDTLQATSTQWQTVTLSLKRYHGSRLALKGFTLGGTSSYIYLGALYIESYKAPSVSIAGATQLMVDNGEGECYIRCIADGNDTLCHITAYPTMITGLTPNTTYNISTQGDADLEGCQASHTLTMPHLESLPYCQGFEESTTVRLGMPAAITTGAGSSTLSSIHSNGQSSLYLTASATADQVYQPLPDYETDKIKELYISFNMRVSYASNTAMEIGVMTDPTNISTYTPIDTIRCSNSNNWEHFTLSLAHYHGDGRHIAFHPLATTPVKYDYYIDELHIDDCPALDATLQQLGARLVRLNNGAAHADYYIEYMPADAPTHSTTLHITSNPYYINDLLPSTTYDFYIRCHADGSNCGNATSITTSQGIALPYCEDFANSDATTLLPHEWQRAGTNTSVAQTANEALRLYTPSGAVILPDFDIDDISKLHLNFKLRSSTPGTRLQVGVATIVENNEYKEFTPVDTIYSTTTDRYSHISLEHYNGNGRYIVLQCLDANWLYIDDLQADTCSIPNDIEVQLVGNATAQINWTNEEYYNFAIEYGTEGFATGTGTALYPKRAPIVLPLKPLTTYQLRPACSIDGEACPARIKITTLSTPLEIPYCQGFESTTELPEYWQPFSYSTTVMASVTARHTGQNGMQLRNANSNDRAIVALPECNITNINQLMLSLWAKGTGKIGIGVMSDATDTTTYHEVASATTTSQYQRIQLSLQDYAGDGRFIAISYSGGTFCFIDDIYISDNGALDFVFVDADATSATFNWRQSGTPAITIEYGEPGFAPGTGTTLHPDKTPYTLTDLQPLHSYLFRISSLSGADEGYCNISTSDTFAIFSPSGEGSCLDATNIQASHVVCSYGSYGNPYANQGIVNYGSASGASRHAIHTDTNERDPRTGALLRTIPKGYNASVRLGNWLTGGNGNAEAEAITYSLVVDHYDLLLLRYAAVLQDPNHSTQQQPRFRIEILDSAGATIGGCASADFIASQSLGWNIADNDVLWKDWTAVAVDLAAYNGKKIYVRMTTYDCDEGSHYGYAYFTFECMQRNINATHCGVVESNTFTAPEGFLYQWYKRDAPSTTLYTSQSITVPASDDYYCCKVAFVDDPECNFTLTAYAGHRYPIANFDATIEERDCKFYVTLHNNSTVSNNSTSANENKEPCQSAIWDLGNGTTTDVYDNIEIVYPDEGEYTILLTAGLSNMTCTANASKTITLKHADSKPYITGSSTHCITAAADTLAIHNAIRCQWLDGTRLNDSMIVATPQTTTTYHAAVTNLFGCKDTLQHTLKSLDTFNITLPSATICTSQLPYTWNNKTLWNRPASGTATMKATTASKRNGCDSTTHITLHLQDILYDTLPAMHRCTSQLPIEWHGMTFDNDYLSQHQEEKFDNGAIPLRHTSISTATGCDSITVQPLVVSDSTVLHLNHITLCASMLPYDWNGQTINSTTEQTTLRHVTTSTPQCDSIVYQTITVIDSAVVRLTPKTICTLPYTWNNITVNNLGDTTLRLQTTSSTSCDSIVYQQLHIYDTASVTLDTQHLCSSALPYSWNSSTIDHFIADTTLKHTTPSLLTGCDSNTYMPVTITDSIVYADSDIELCSKSLPYTWNGITLANTIGDTLLRHATLSLRTGCDSINYKKVTIIDSILTYADSTICLNQLPYSWQEHLIDTKPTNDTLLRHFSSAGCNTINYLTLHIFDTATVMLPQENICTYQLPYTWNDNTIDKEYLSQHSTSTVGIHTVNIKHTCKSVLSGCDSNTLLTLVVIDSLTTHLNDTTICVSQLPFEWNGTTIERCIFTDGQYHQELRHATASTLTGCDSINYQHLAVRDSIVVNLPPYKVCSSQLPHTWNSHTLPTTLIVDNDSIINKTLDTTLRYATTTVANGCDSITYQPFHLALSTQSTTTTESCEFYFWNMLRRTRTGTYTYKDTNHLGCDSTATLHLTIHKNSSSTLYDTFCHGTRYYYTRANKHNDSLLSTPGKYIDTLVNQYSCDSVVTLLLAEKTAPETLFDTFRLCHDNMYGLTMLSAEDNTYSLLIAANNTMPLAPHHWDNEWGRYRTDTVIQANSPITYTLITDYTCGLSCPARLIYSTKPYTIPHAILDVHPSVLSDDQRDMLILDKSLYSTSRRWWADDDMLPSSNASTHYTTLKNEDSVRITLIAIDSACTDTAYQAIAINRRAFYVPNTFAPSSDNPSYFGIYAINLATIDLYVYNRQGLLVFHTTDNNEKWDGTHNGTECPMGSYIYTVRYSFVSNPNSYYQRKGSVMLIR